MSSVVGLHGNAGQTNYAASKGGVIALTKALAKEVGSRGIRVNCIAPGYITTELTDVLPEAARGRNPRPDAAGAAWRPRRRRACRTVPPLGRRRLHHRARSCRSTAGWGCSVERRRVVVTGIGAVNAVGTGVPDFLQGLREGRPGRRADHAVRRHRTRPSRSPARSRTSTRPRCLDKKTARRTDRYSHFAVARRPRGRGPRAARDRARGRPHRRLDRLGHRRPEHALRRRTSTCSRRASTGSRRSGCRR